MAFKKKQPEQAALKIGLYGIEGSGKTFTSLLIAEGLAKGKRIAVVDTEHGFDFYAQKVKQRAAHPNAFDFDAIDTRSLTDTIDEIKAINTDEYSVIILDSISHLWDAAINAYDGSEDENGDIPAHAWGKIKRPYKELMGLLLSSPLHVIICGREADRYEGDAVVGKRMRAEKETMHEPHLVLRLAPLKTDTSVTYRAFVEKDRTGILSGKIIENPDFEQICAPLLPLLGKKQAKIESDDSVAAKDAVAMVEKERTKSRISETFKDDFIARFTLAKTLKELESISSEISPVVREQITAKDLAKLRQAHQLRCAIIKGEAP